VRAVFLGNHTVGVTVMRELAAQGMLAGVVAHPPDPEDGVRYLSVFDAAGELGAPRLRARGSDPDMTAFVKACAPDLLVVADYRYLLPVSLLKCARHGGINFHPSLLPAYRGRAPINWAILHGETTLGLTVHCIDAGMDTGDILAQEPYHLDTTEDVGDALRKLYPLYADLTRKVVAMVQKGPLPQLPQNHAMATAFPRRRPEDGELDFNVPAAAALNLVRAVARPYPGAFAWCDGCKIVFWKARMEPAPPVGSPPAGTITHAARNSFCVQCGQGRLRVLQWEANTPAWRPEAGQRFLPGISREQNP
jgi:Methionyl-tRNA formyltransferase